LGDAAEEVKVLARSHQSLIWARQRQVNVLRSNLREYFPAALAAFGSALADRDAIAVLAVAPGPEKARKLSSAKIQSLLRKAGRSRYLQSRADEITSALQSEQLEARAGIEAAYTATTKALVAVIAELNNQIQALQEQVEECFGRHLDAEIYLSQPGLGSCARCSGACRVRRRPPSLRRCSGTKKLLRDESNHACLRQEKRGAGPLCPQPPARRCAIRSGICSSERLARCPGVLCRPPSTWSHTPSSATRTRQQPGRHPARLLTPPHPLRRKHRMDRSEGRNTQRGLTA
jgi:hypothetical protein